MALPKIDTATYTIKLPSTGKDIKIRPFLVKEEKIILIALQEDNFETVVDAIKTVISNCTFGAVKVEELTSYDIEYLFIQLRIKSKGGTLPMSFVCSNNYKNPETEKDEICNNIVEVDINLEDVRVEGETGKKTKKIILDENKNLGIIMKMPDFSLFETLKDEKDDNKQVQKFYDMIPTCVDHVFEGEQIYDDFTSEEFVEWLDCLDDNQFTQIKEFFNNIPTVYLEHEITCSKCKNKEVLKIKGLNNFLA